MRNAFNESMRKVGAPLAEFWENDLELGLEDILRRLSNDGHLSEWAGSLNGRCAAILCRNLGFAAEDTIHTRRAAIQACNGTLTPYHLVACFANRQSSIAVVELAQRRLPKEVVEQCRVNDEKFDVPALLFALYRENPMLLRDVFHLSKIHRKGFARMEMSTQARKPADRTFEDYLRSDDVRGALRQADSSLADGHTSEFRDVIELNGRLLVFVRRAERPEHIVHENKIIHGHRPEWIILDFEDGAKRVNIASRSIAESLELANQLASGYFGKEVSYANESEVTYAKQLERLLACLKEGQDEKMTFVELIFTNSPLDGSPKLKISDQKAIGPAIAHFESVIGGLLEHLSNIESIKVCFAKKRVSVIFERDEEHEDDEFVVRYSDNRLNVFERQEFENHMRKTYGIPILSTEKRFKKQS